MDFLFILINVYEITIRIKENNLHLFVKNLSKNLSGSEKKLIYPYILPLVLG